MSRHELEGRDGTTVALGWDNPLQTYFTTVEQDGAEILWLGGSRGEVRHPEELVEPLALYLTVGPELLATLRADRAACLDRGPSRLQRGAYDVVNGLPTRGR